MPADLFDPAMETETDFSAPTELAERKKAGGQRAATPLRSSRCGYLLIAEGRRKGLFCRPSLQGHRTEGPKDGVTLPNQTCRLTKKKNGGQGDPPPNPRRQGNHQQEAKKKFEKRFRKKGLQPP